jgi:uncharacterized protein YaiE (UPF0345 family)
VGSKLLVAKASRYQSLIGSIVTNDPMVELRLDKAADAIFKMYQESAFQQTEAAYNFQNIVTNGEMRFPQPDEVRGFIMGVVRGSLNVQPPRVTPWQRFMIWMRTA